MTVPVYNSVELRFATGELASHNFVTETDYNLSREYGRKMLSQVIQLSGEKANQEELLAQIEELKAARNYWHHMYNQATAPEVVDNESGLVNEMPEQ